ncbi:TatD family hydrolase [Moraxella boevrei]|uniref:TatD family hydrolase n=1 Tax=Faucicola boevrei TaxID=346665 RepID=UPI003734EDC2
MTTAILALADGTTFIGKSIGVDGQTVGEVAFNTAMTGYQEILTDPSYAKQMVTLTYPHIGNTGCNEEDTESGRIHKVWASGLIIRDLPLLHSNFRSQMSLSEYLIKHNVVAIGNIDTRKLTRILREKGAQNGAIVVGDDVERALERALELAKTALDMGLYISFSGIVSFKKSVELQEVAKKLPLDRILIETDSPYLAPVPKRGRDNEPSFVPYVAKALGDIFGKSAEEIGVMTSANFDNLLNQYG